MDQSSEIGTINFPKLGTTWVFFIDKLNSDEL
jgi:hypothetical protein